MANCVPVGPISYTVPTAPAAGGVAGSVVIVTSPPTAPAGIDSASLPSEDATAPPDMPTTVAVGMAPGGCPPGPPPPQPAKTAIGKAANEKNDVRMVRSHRSLDRGVECFFARHKPVAI